MKASRRQSFDLDEVAPNHFAIGNPHITSAIKSEGVVTGRMFELTGWRREGFIARLRERGFAVRTIADRIASLPAPPEPLPIGAPGWRAQATPIEQVSHFDLGLLRWHTLPSEQRDGVAGVMICDGWVLRRRKGRNPATFYLAHRERAGGVGLQPLDETAALLQGFAQALAFDSRPLLVGPAGAADGPLLLPAIELPRPYREALTLCAKHNAAGWLVERSGWPLAQELFARLGVRLTLDEVAQPPN